MKKSENIRNRTIYIVRKQLNIRSMHVLLVLEKRKAQRKRHSPWYTSHSVMECAFESVFTIPTTYELEWEKLYKTSSLQMFSTFSLSLGSRRLVSVVIGLISFQPVSIKSRYVITRLVIFR